MCRSFVKVYKQNIRKSNSLINNLRVLTEYILNTSIKKAVLSTRPKKILSKLSCLTLQNTLSVSKNNSDVLILSNKIYSSILPFSTHFCTQSLIVVPSLTYFCKKQKKICYILRVTYLICYTQYKEV